MLITAGLLGAIDCGHKRHRASFRNAHVADGLTEAVTSVHDPEDGPYCYYLAYLAYLDASLKPGQRRKGWKPRRVSGLFSLGFPAHTACGRFGNAAHLLVR